MQKGAIGEIDKWGRPVLGKNNLQVIKMIIDITMVYKYKHITNCINR